MKTMFGLVLDGAALSPVLSAVLGCIFGLVAFVLLNSVGESLDGMMHWGIAIVVALIAAGGIYVFLKPGQPLADSHH